MVSELREAQAIGLIPDILSGTDFTQPITRIEFAHLLILLCETYTGVTTLPLNSNPFTDTDDQYALKAQALGIMAGTEPALFSPAGSIDRETMAIMLYRAIRLIAPLADYLVYSITVPYIPDYIQISEGALPSVGYLYSREIVRGGHDNLFMPRPITDEQTAENFGIATREQCVVLAKRIYEKLPDIVNSRNMSARIGEVRSFVMDEPQGGAEIDRDELIAILRPYANKVRWADNMSTLMFTGDFQRTGGGDWAQGYDSALFYSAYSSRGESQYKYDYETYLWGAPAGKSRYSLAIDDADLQQLKVYEWNSESETGTEALLPFRQANLFSSAGFPGSLIYYMPSRVYYVYKLFDDVVLNGEIHKVFSVTRSEMGIESDAPPAPPVGGPPTAEREVTDYYFISTVTGLCTLQTNYGTIRDTTYLAMRIVFSMSPSLTDTSEITPPSNIVFNLVN